MPFREARAFARDLKLKSYRQWCDYCAKRLGAMPERPLTIPANPRRTYANRGWKGYADWLGTDNIGHRWHQYAPFEEARAFARSLKLRVFLDWLAFTKGEMPWKGHLPRDIPATPSHTYANKGWAGFKDWLGTANLPRRRPATVGTRIKRII